jgi:hypothetical protein
MPKRPRPKRPCVHFFVTDEEYDLFIEAANIEGIRAYNTWARARLLRDAREEVEAFKRRTGAK